MIFAVLHCRLAPAWTPYQCLHTPRLVCIPRRMNVTSATSESEASPDIIKEEKDVVVQYVVLWRDLFDTWLLGSIITQGCHASVSAKWDHTDGPLTLGYCSPENIDSMHKVTLEVKGETQIINLAEKLKTDRIDHKLWIEKPENIPTCLATKPYNKSAVSSYFKKLKLCEFLKRNLLTSQVTSRPNCKDTAFSTFSGRS